MLGTADMVANDHRTGILSRATTFSNVIPCCYNPFHELQ